MNGPLLTTLLPPDRAWDADGPAPDSVPFVAVMLLAGFLLCLLLRHPER